MSGDSVTIAVGHTVTLDVDQSGFASGLAGLTINGVLQCTTASGTYSIKMTGTSGQNITGTGQLLAGSSGTPLPSTTKFYIYLGTASYINAASLQVLLYCTQPTYPYIRLTAQKVANDTVLSVDSDISGDIWTVGDPLVLVNVNSGNDFQGVGSNPRTLAAKSSTTITLSSTGLDSTNIVGAYVFLATRNIEIQATGSAQILQGTATRQVVLRCSIRQTGASRSGQGLGITSNVLMSGIISGFSYGLNGTDQNVSGIVVGCDYGAVGGYSLNFSGIMHAANTAIHSNEAAIISGTIIGSGTAYGGTAATFTSTALIYGCDAGLTTSHCEFAGTVQKCSRGVTTTRSILRGASFSNNGADITVAAQGRPHIVGYGTTLGSTTPVTFYSYTDIPVGWQGVFMYDADGVAGRVKAWTNGGVVTTDTGTYPTGYTQSYKYAHERAANPIYLDFPLFVNAGTASISVAIKKSANGFTETPVAQLIDPNVEMFSAGSVLTSATMTDDTNWQTLSLNYVAAYARQLILRVRARNASGNVWWNFTSTFGSGGRVSVGKGLVN